MRATNFNVILLVLLAFTVFIMNVRHRKPLENNWPLVYWVLMLVFTLTRPEDSFDAGIILVGVAAALMLRFEFINDFIAKGFKTLEFLIWCYVLIRGVNIVFA